MKTWILAAGAVLAGTTLAAADPIEGRWKMPSGYTAQIAPCSAGFCLTYVDGPYSGQTFGTMQPTGGSRYQGTVTDYTDGGKEYSGRGSLSGDTLTVSGCVLFGVLCRDQTLTRV